MNGSIKWFKWFTAHTDISKGGGVQSLELRGLNFGAILPGATLRSPMGHTDKPTGASRCWKVILKIITKYREGQLSESFCYSKVSLVGLVLRILKVLSCEKYFTVPQKYAMVRYVCNICIIPRHIFTTVYIIIILYL
jgi:hypothetical protein